MIIRNLPYNDNGLDWVVDQYNRNRDFKDHITIDDLVSAEKLADEISFRLMATKKHPDYEWLNQKLIEYVKANNK